MLAGRAGWRDAVVLDAMERFCTLSILIVFCTGYLSAQNRSQVAGHYINYCNLFEAGEYYGQLSLTPQVLSTQNVNYFNDLISTVYTNFSGIKLIGPAEFTSSQVYKLGNKTSFPSESGYHPSQSSAYVVFHLAKELRRWGHQDPSCGPCDSISLQIINNLLAGTRLWDDFYDTQRITRNKSEPLARHEVKDLLRFFNCYFFDVLTNPLTRRESKVAPMVIPLDTVSVTCFDDIKIKTPLVLPTCDQGGTWQPLHAGKISLIRGTDNCENALYRYGALFISQCGVDTSYQYFKINKRQLKLVCPPDTIVQCFEDIKGRAPALIDSCGVNYTVNFEAPKLISGKHKCAGSKYVINTILINECGLQFTCAQIFIIKGFTPAFKKPLDRVVSCKIDIKLDTPEVTQLCPIVFKWKISGPTLRSGRDDCPGSVYEVNYSYQDSCNQKFDFIQKFTIDKNNLSIVCKPDTVVKCLDDIPDEDVQVNSPCSRLYKVLRSKPKLLSGKMGCPGSKYYIDYTAEDMCGQKATCRRIFVLDTFHWLIYCPKDEIVKCKEEINGRILANIDKIILSTHCGKSPEIKPSEPILKSGEDDCPQAIYEVTYEIDDSCRSFRPCIQRFIISERVPALICPPDRTVSCYDDIKAESPILTENCSSDFHFIASKPKLVTPGEPDKCPGAEYIILYTITDDCDFSYHCSQKFTIEYQSLQIICPPDTVVSRREDIRPSAIKIINPCNNPYTAEISPVIWDSGKPDGCPGSVYRIEYTVKDHCGNKVICLQKFTLQPPPVTINCPPDKKVRCRDDIFPDAQQSWLSGGVQLVHTTDPLLKSGTADCSGAVYEIIYSFLVHCMDTIFCRQKFILVNEGPKMICPADQVITSIPATIDHKPTITVDCNLSYNLTIGDPQVVSGNFGVPGSEYYVHYQVEDACKRTTKCTQKLTLIGLDPQNPDCPYPQSWFGISQQRGYLRDDRFREDIAKLLHDKTCEWIESLVLGGINNFYREWASAQIIGNQSGLAAEIARRGNIAMVLSKIGEIKLAIQTIEAALYGDADELREIITPEMLRRMSAYLSGSATPGAVLNVIQQLGAFAEYLNQDILRINLNTFADLARRDNQFFNADHFLVTYAGLNELRNAGVNYIDPYKFRQVIYEYTRLRMNNYPLPYTTDIWKSQQNLNAFRTATRTMLNEVCHLYHQRIKLHQELSRLKTEQSLVERFQEVWNNFAQFRCPPCASILNVTVVQTALGIFDCQCNPPYKWSPDNTACVTVENCNLPNTNLVYRQQKYECDCVTGFMWNVSRTECIPLVPQCLDPHAEPVWNSTAQAYECHCKSGYEYNFTTGKCEIKVPTCPDPNAEPVWNNTVNAYECRCRSGYEYNFSSGKCEVPVPTCPDPNAQVVWNPQVNAYECHCISGYYYNPASSRCEKNIPDCEATLANSQAIWNPNINDYECHCLPGYYYDVNTNQCEIILPDCPGFYPNTEAVWDPVKKEYVCACLRGFEWNNTRTGCEKKDPVQPTNVINTLVDALLNPSGGSNNPTVKPEHQRSGQCNTTYKNGANEPEQYTITLNSNIGTVTFTYETYQAEDRIHIYQGFAKIFDSGCIGTNGTRSAQLVLNGSGNQVRIIIDPLCDPTDNQTAWEFTLGCPQ